MERINHKARSSITGVYILYKGQEQKAFYQRMTLKQAEVNEFMEKKTNIMTFVTAPFIALGFDSYSKGRD